MDTLKEYDNISIWQDKTEMDNKSEQHETNINKPRMNGH